MTPIKCPGCGGGGSRNRPPDNSDEGAWSTWLAIYTVNLWPCDTCNDTGVVWDSHFVETVEV